MQTKRILFKTSGIFKIIVGACVFGLFALILLLGGLLKDMLIEDTEMLNSVVNEIVRDDPEYTFLLAYEAEELVDYLFGTLYGIVTFMTLWGVASIGIGIFTLIVAKKYDIWFRGKLKNKILFTIFDYILYVGLVFNILTTIATFIKDKPRDEIGIR